MAGGGISITALGCSRVWASVCRSSRCWPGRPRKRARTPSACLLIFGTAAALLLVVVMTWELARQLRRNDRIRMALERDILERRAAEAEVRALNQKLTDNADALERSNRELESLQLLGLARPARAAAPHRRLRADAARGRRRAAGRRRRAATSTHRRQRAPHGRADRRPARVLAPRPQAARRCAAST